MTILAPKVPAVREDHAAALRALRRTMQDIVIAHAAICFKHMTPEQLAAAQEEWSQTVRGKGWASFFTDDTGPLPGPSREQIE